MLGSKNVKVDNTMEDGLMNIQRSQGEERLIYKSNDPFNNLAVLENNTYRRLVAGDASTAKGSQTVMRLDSPDTVGAPYIFDMLMLLLFNPNPQAVLVLGVGGGDIVKFICKHFPQCHVDGVDINSLMFEIAEKYFYLPKSDHLHLHVCDALEFLKKGTRTYDMIFVDLFLGLDFPPCIYQQEFFQLCRSRLNDKGMLAMNTSRKTPQEHVEKVIKALAHTFGNILLPLQQTTRRMKGNVVFLTFVGHTHYKTSQIIRNAKMLDKQTNHPFRYELKKFRDFQDWKYVGFYCRTLFKRNKIQRLKIAP